MINVKMWGKALKIIPRISQSDWKELDVISRWLIITRAAVFVMTAMSAGVGGLLAFRDGYWSWPLYIACLLGLVFAHGTNNLLNDLTDYSKGIDSGNYYRSQYGPQPLEHKLLTKKQHFKYILITGLLALSCGAYLTFQTGWLTLALMGIGAFFVLFYTWPLKYIGLGEPAVLIVWGPLMIGGTYYILSGGQWNWSIVFISLAYAIGPTTVLFGKHIDKIKDDKKKKVYTLPVILGEKAARWTAICLWIIQYALVAWLVYSGSLKFAMLIIIFAFPSFFKTAKVFSKPRPEEAPEDLPDNVWPLYLSATAFVYNKSVGGLFLLGLIVDVMLIRFGIY